MRVLFKHDGVKFSQAVCQLYAAHDSGDRQCDEQTLKVIVIIIRFALS